jgi:hypothetical protein
VGEHGFDWMEMSYYSSGQRLVESQLSFFLGVVRGAGSLDMWWSGSERGDNETKS